MIAEASPERERSHSLWLLPIRFLLYWLIKIVVLLFVGLRFFLRPRLVRYAFVLVAVGGVVASGVFTRPVAQQQPVEAPAAEIISTVATSQLPQPPVVEHYLKSQAEFNAAGMWEAMSDSMKQFLATSNGSQDQLQAELENARLQEREYSNVAYIGGAQLSNNRSVYFYIVTVKASGNSVQVPYTFIVGQDGKIANIQALGR